MNQLKETTPKLTPTKKKEVNDYIKYIQDATGIKFRCRRLKDYIFIKALYLLLSGYDSVQTEFYTSIKKEYINEKYTKKIESDDYFGYPLYDILKEYVVKYYYGDLSNFAVVWELYEDLTRDEWEERISHAYKVLDKKATTNSKKIINLLDNIGTQMIDNNTFYLFEDLKKEDPEITLRWMTERDERVCKICAPLNGTTYRYLRDVPSRHPNCRCDILIYKDGKLFTKYK